MKAYQNETIAKLEMLEKKIKNNPLLKSNDEIIKKIIYILKHQATEEFDSVITNYCTIIKILSDLPISDFDRMRLFFDIIKVNLKILEISNNPLLISTDIIELFQKKNLDYNILKELLLGIENEEERNQIIKNKFPLEAEYIINSFKINSQIIPEMKNNFRLLKNHYYDKKGHISELDYDIIMEILHKMMIPKMLLNFLQTELKKAIVEDYKIFRNNSNGVTLTWEKAYKDTADTEKPLSKKERYQLVNQVHRYYNIDDNREIRPLNPLEKIELIILLKKLRYSQKEIDDILNKLNKKFCNDALQLEVDKPMRSAVMLNTLLKKLEYYHMESQIAEIKELVSIIRITKNNKEREQWKNELKNIIARIYLELPNDNEFEISISEKTLNRKKKK